ncbi:MAG TPA: hemerythrin domain-containing protein [Candidatus Baltobacteraceae bacterium]|nr:hemerythrin domain-containing protein [Candidatus Baltobacteraceae bacterium]
MQSDMNVLPARGNDAIEILVNDHETIKSLLSQLTQASDGTRKGMLEQLKAVLTIHNATEENLVYPALREVAGKKAESLKLYNETAEADSMLFQLDTMLKEGDVSKFGKVAEQLQAAILEHIDDEENKAFPHLEKGAEPQQAQMLTQSVREFRSALRFEPAGYQMRSTGTEIGEIGSEAPMGVSSGDIQET